MDALPIAPSRAKVAADLSGTVMKDCDVCINFFAQTCVARVQHWSSWEAHVKSHWPKPKKTYAFTFTTNLDTKLEVQKEMCYSAYKLFLQKTTPVEEGEVYLEYTEEGRPHLHGWYVTEDGGRIFAKTFRRCWPTWGEKERKPRFAGGYHEEMKTNRYRGYASSEGRLVVVKKKNEDVRYEPTNADVWHLETAYLEPQILYGDKV